MMFYQSFTLQCSTSHVRPVANLRVENVANVMELPITAVDRSEKTLPLM
jgi:hypothetical protein